jgi:predicted GTPase
VNIQEFESQYQESVSKILNELQSMAIISNRLESTIVEVGASVQSLNQMVDNFLREQQNPPNTSDKTLS